MPLTIGQVRATLLNNLVLVQTLAVGGDTGVDSEVHLTLQSTLKALITSAASDNSSIGRLPFLHDTEGTT